MEDLIFALVKPEPPQPVRRPPSAAARPCLGVPPWRLRSEQASILEPELERRCRAVVELSLAFFCEPAALGVPPDFPLTELASSAVAALHKDPGLAAFFESQVPSQMDSAKFWFCYFSHVARHRHELLSAAHSGGPPSRAPPSDPWEDFWNVDADEAEAPEKPRHSRHEPAWPADDVLPPALFVIASDEG